MEGERTCSELPPAISTRPRAGAKRPIVRSTPSKQAAEYHALVMVVLELLAHAEGSMEARRG